MTPFEFAHNSFRVATRALATARDEAAREAHDVVVTGLGAAFLAACHVAKIDAQQVIAHIIENIDGTRTVSVLPPYAREKSN